MRLGFARLRGEQREQADRELRAEAPVEQAEVVAVHPLVGLDRVDLVRVRARARPRVAVRVRVRVRVLRFDRVDQHVHEQTLQPRPLAPVAPGAVAHVQRALRNVGPAAAGHDRHEEEVAHLVRVRVRSRVRVRGRGRGRARARGRVLGVGVG